MSRIYEQLRTAQKTRQEAGLPKGTPRGASPYDRRRSRRQSLHVPVFVYGHLSTGKKPFYEEAYLQQVSAEGGLLTLSTGVKCGQKLLLTNSLTQKEQKCFVVHSRSRNPRRLEVGVEFAQPCPEFVQSNPRKDKN